MAEFKGISKQAYVEADNNTRHSLTYDMFAEIQESHRETCANISSRVTILENNKVIDRVISAMAGFIGGIAGIFGLK